MKEKKNGRKAWVIVLIGGTDEHAEWRWRFKAESAAECKGERNILVNACKGVIRQKSPTPYCCQRLRVTHVNGVCPIITPQLAALIDVNYAIKVIQGCGRQVPRHFKCG
ncbi:hypothetical protein Golob_024353, partial [Gossypium lobatum]|nr:hypothetical protein [Gossypium lobatum]